MKKLALVVALVCAFSAAGAEINLTPDYSFRELEGCKFPQLVFRDGGKKITYEAPKEWRTAPQDPRTLSLLPPGKDMVSAKIKFIAIPGPLVLDEAQLKHFKDTASQLLPQESKIIGEPTVTPNPLVLDDHATCEMEIQFVLHAQRLRMSVLFVDLGGAQLRFSLISRARDFEELHKVFQESWYSWQWRGRDEGK